MPTSKKMPWIQSHIEQKNDRFTLSSSSSSSLPYNGYYNLKDSITPSSSSSSSSARSKITPAILFIIVIVAVIFFVSGLLNLVVRFLLKHRSSSSNSHSNRYPEMSSSNSTFQRQLQHLFQLHDSGLDQSFIDAFPVFHYKELMMDGLKEPFDCPVCLSEFSQQDKLRLLPLCSHAFHINCIDTWLLSNSTCPLCRGTLYNPGLPIENQIFDFENSREEVCFSGRLGDGVLSSGSKQGESGIMNGKRVFSVRLGKYRSINNEVTTREEEEEAEPSNSNLDARRCYSMGSFQYVVANSDLQVTLCRNKAAPKGDGDLRTENRREDGNIRIDRDCEGKKINIGSKNESFSVSKVWLWSKKGKFTSSSSNIHMDADLNLSWANSNTNPI